MQRLYPSPAAAISLLEAYDVVRPRPAHRPWVGLCMVASVDGSTAIDGSSGGLSNPADVELLLTLRDLSDVVIVGAGTARGEGYGVPRKPSLRIGVVSRNGAMDYSTPLFTSGRGFMIALASARSTLLRRSRNWMPISFRPRAGRNSTVRSPRPT
jgi:riboflavin biosynthesis pyrimidine reductase